MPTQVQHEMPLHEHLLSKPAHKQLDCPLFKWLPGEIRGYIFAYALTDYEEPSDAEQYVKDSCWARPSYESPRRTDTAILQTCRAIYSEAWFKPFTLKEQTHWISSYDRAPPHYNLGTAAMLLKRTVDAIKQQHKQPTVEIDSIRIFTQMFMLEGDDVKNFLASVPALEYRHLYITIRHADFWFWEGDEPLRFEGEWIPGLCSVLPSTVREVTIEMETVKRKERQLDKLANQMNKRWHFRTKDGASLFADSTPNSHETTRWQGSSSWHNKRWIRDEVSDGVIEYYVGAVRFRPKRFVEAAGGTVSDEALRAATQTPFVATARVKLHLPDETAIDCPTPFIRTKTNERCRDYSDVSDGQWESGSDWNEMEEDEDDDDDDDEEEEEEGQEEADESDAEGS